MDDWYEFSESYYRNNARSKTQEELIAVRREINSGTWTGASIRLYELRQQEAELENYLQSLSE